MHCEALSYIWQSQIYAAVRSLVRTLSMCRSSEVAAFNGCFADLLSRPSLICITDFSYMAQPAGACQLFPVVKVGLNNINMIVPQVVMGTAWLTLFLSTIVADDPPCEPNCPDPFPPGHKNIGDAWWAIGDEASGAYITNLVTTLEVPPKPDGVTGLRMINSALDNSVSSRLLRFPHNAVSNLPKNFYTTS